MFKIVAKLAECNLRNQNMRISGQRQQSDCMVNPRSNEVICDLFRQLDLLPPCSLLPVYRNCELVFFRLFRFLVRASRDLWAFLLGEGRFPGCDPR